MVPLSSLHPFIEHFSVDCPKNCVGAPRSQNRVNKEIDNWKAGWKIMNVLKTLPMGQAPWILAHFILLCVCACVFVCVQLLQSFRLSAILWTVACQTPLSMERSQQEYWSELPFPPSGDLPDPGINPHFLHWRQIFTHWATYIMATYLYFSVLPIWCRIIIVFLQVNESGFRCAKKLDHKARK